MRREYTFDCPVCRGELKTSEAYSDPRAFVMQANMEPGGLACAGCSTIALFTPEGAAWVGRFGQVPEDWQAFSRSLEEPEANEPGQVLARRPVTRAGRPEGK